MGSSAWQRASPPRDSPNTAGHKEKPSATPRKPPATGRCRAAQRWRKKPPCRAARTLFLLLLAAFRQAHLAPLAFHQLAQIVEQPGVPLAQNFHQKRQRKKRAWGGIQHLEKGVAGCLAMQLLAAESRSVAKRPPILGSR